MPPPSAGNTVSEMRQIFCQPFCSPLDSIQGTVFPAFGMEYSQRIAADFCQPFCSPLDSIQGAVYPAFGMEYSQQIAADFCQPSRSPLFSVYIYERGRAPLSYAHSKGTFFIRSPPRNYFLKIVFPR